ncbi:unnamed protein product [Rhodiola kirilowii]
MGMDDKPDSKTFSVMDEDHTFANSVRFALNQDPRVVFCGYSIPHPSENRVNIRVQTSGAPANEVFRDGCESLTSICQHVRDTFSNAVQEFKRKQASMDKD